MSVTIMVPEYSFGVGVGDGVGVGVGVGAGLTVIELLVPVWPLVSVAVTAIKPLALKVTAPAHVPEVKVAVEGETVPELAVKATLPLKLAVLPKASSAVIVMLKDAPACAVDAAVTVNLDTAAGLTVKVVVYAVEAYVPVIVQVPASAEV